jgi:hypothetical protein
MTGAPSSFDPYVDKRSLLKADDKRHYQRIFTAQAVRSYLFLSLGIGVIAALLPILLMISGGYETHDSISSYYHDPAGPTRDILVGSLCAIGVFLLLFHGLSKLENWLLNFAGIASISVALNPSPGEGRGSLLLHTGSAIVFFILLGAVAVLLSKGRIKDIVDPRRRRWFKSAYNTAGLAMVAMPIAVVALHFVTGGQRHWVFWTECAGIWSFAAYWFVKTSEYRLLLRVRWTVPVEPPPFSQGKARSRITKR